MFMLTQEFKEKTMNSLVDFSVAKEIIFIRAINKSNLQPDSIYKEIGDIAATVYFYIGDIADRFVSAQVPKTFLESWKLTESEVYSIAEENSRKLFPVKCYDILNPWGKGINLFSNECKLSTEICRPSCISTSMKTNGASAIFWPGVKERIGELLNGNYYIVFTSVHEAMIHKDSNEDSFKEFLKENLNATIEAVVCEDEVLTREVFYYNRQTKELSYG